MKSFLRKYSLKKDCCAVERDIQNNSIIHMCCINISLFLNKKFINFNDFYFITMVAGYVVDRHIYSSIQI